MMDEVIKEMEEMERMMLILEDLRSKTENSETLEIINNHLDVLKLKYENLDNKVAVAGNWY